MSKIVWTNGCFDLLHPGHIELFKIGKSLGDKLIVGLDSDERVRDLKGDTRPINTFIDRKEILEAIAVDSWRACELVGRQAYRG